MTGVPLTAAWLARLRMLSNGVRASFRRSPWRALAMVAVALGLSVGGRLLAEEVVRWIHGIEVIGPILCARLLSLFLFLLFILLATSNLIIAFMTLLRSAEAAFWMASPLTPKAIVDARSPEIAVLASWAFVFLGTPLLLGWGAGTGAGPAYLLAVPVVLVAFAALAHAVGLLAMLLAARVLPVLDLRRLVGVTVLLALPFLAALVVAFRTEALPEGADGLDLVVRALDGLGRAQFPLLPGWWAAEALRAAAASDLGRSAFFTWALVVSAAFGLLLSREAAAAFLRPAFWKRRTRAGGRRVTGWRLGPAGGPMLALSRKDLLVLCRDPAQWAQVLLLVVLASAYLLNLRNVPGISGHGAWAELVAWLNVAVLLLLVATLATRFGFPLLSLEGRRAWIVFAAPVRRSLLAWQKLAVAWPLSCAFGLGAGVVSVHVLDLPAGQVAVTLAAVVLGSFALSGLAVGLGAVFPELHQDSPARIVSGFGGTATFLLSVALVVIGALLLATPAVLAATGRIEAGRAASLAVLARVVAAVLALVVGLGAVALGARHLERLEA